MSSSSPAAHDRPDRRLAVALRVAAAGVALVGAGAVGLKMSTLHGNVSPVWPSTGVAIWLLIVFGWRAWPVVTVATLIVESALAGFPLVAAGTMAGGATIEALVGAWLWRTVGTRWPGAARDVVAYVATALAAPMASATAGTVALVLMSEVQLPVADLWVTWWMGDAVGVLVLLPVLLVAREMGAMVRRGTAREAGRAALVLGAAVGACWLSFSAARGGAWLFAVFPVLILATVWFGVPGVRLFAMGISIAGIAAEYGGAWVFGSENLHSELLNLQLFLVAVVVVALVLPLFRARGITLLPVSVLLIGWLLSGWIFTTLQRDDRRRQEEVFNERVAAAEAAIRVRMTSYVDALVGGAGFFSASRTVERDEWRVYASSLHLGVRFPGINGIGIIYPLQPAEVPAWIERMEAEGAPGLTVKPFPATTGPEDDVKYVITYVEPLALNIASVGRNIATEPSRRRAAELARDTGEPRMNRRIPGSRDAQRRSGFLLYVPLYRNGAPVETVAERRAAHVGWVYAQFFADNFLNGVLGPMGDTLRLHFFEDGELGPQHLLYASAATDGASGVIPRFERVTAMEMAGQRFRLGWQRGPKYVGGERSPVAWAAVSFTFATLLLAGLVQSLQTTGQRARDLAAERTRDLAAAQSRLQAVLDGSDFSVIATAPDGRIEVFNAGAERMLGYSAAEMVGRQSPVVLHAPAELQARALELGAQLDRRIEPGFEVLVACTRVDKTDEREWTYVRKDGTRLPVLLSVTALRDSRGSLIGFVGIAQDITVRKQVERVREEELARLTKLGAQVPGFIYQFLMRPDGSSCFPYASEGIRKIYRLAPDDVRRSAACVFDVLHPDDRAAVEESIRVSAGTLQPWHHEYRVRYADGTVRWLLGHSVPEREPDGSVLWHGFITDVTERRRVDRALAEQEARLRLVLEEMPVGVRWVRHVDGRQETVLNPAHELITGVAKNDSNVPGIYLARTHPDDIPVQEEGMARLRRGELRTFAMEKRYLIPGADIRWVAVTWMRRVLPGTGNFEELSTVKDITERKESEAALRASEERTRLFVMHAPAAVAMFDRDMRYVVVSRAWMEAYALAGDVIGRSHYEVFPEIGAEWKAIHRRCLAGAVESNEADLFVRADGTRQWLRWEVRPWAEASGRIGGIVMFTADITERKKLEENLALARDQALEGSRLKSEFLATISHEIRTPMNAVIGMAEMLVDTGLNADQEEMARTVVGGAENLLVIVNDILDFSRIEAGRVRLDPVDFDLRRVIEETAVLLAQRAHEKGVELTCEFDSAPLPLLLGDSGRVRQIVTNLIGNAIKFTDAGEVNVRVAVVSGAANRTRVRVTVRDTGVGISREAQPRLFQPFTQADGSTTRRFGGTGLGLAISRQLVELMGGEIGFESEPGRGALFWFELELVPRGPVPPAPALTIPADRHVLVVDDNETNRRILVDQLTRWGLRAEGVAGGAAALARLRQAGSGPWHLVLLDGHMPAMSGPELAAQIRSGAAHADLPLVLLSSGGVQPGFGGPAAVGFAATLTKPVTAQQLGNCLARVLAVAPLASSPVPARAAADERFGLRLLLAEDNPANQRVAVLMLEKMGYVVEVAANGQVALGRLAEREFDAVLMDCQMPVLDGYETTRRIRSGGVAGANARLPIIALTAYARPEDRARCLDAGMDDYVTKPIRASELRAALLRCGLGLAALKGGVAGPMVPGATEGVFDEEALESARSLPGAGGPSLLPELIEVYLSDEAERLERLARLAAERRAVDLGEEAHGFGGNAASFGGIQVRRVALDLERDARAGRWSDVDARLVQLRAACELLRSEVKRRNLGAR